MHLQGVPTEVSPESSDGTPSESHWVGGGENRERKDGDSLSRLLEKVRGIEERLALLGHHASTDAWYERRIARLETDFRLLSGENTWQDGNSSFGGIIDHNNNPYIRRFHPAVDIAAVHFVPYPEDASKPEGVHVRPRDDDQTASHSWLWWMTIPLLITLPCCCYYYYYYYYIIDQRRVIHDVICDKTKTTDSIEHAHVAQGRLSTQPTSYLDDRVLSNLYLHVRADVPMSRAIANEYGIQNSTQEDQLSPIVRILYHTIQNIRNIEKSLETLSHTTTTQAFSAHEILMHCIQNLEAKIHQLENRLTNVHAEQVQQSVLGAIPSFTQNTHNMRSPSRADSLETQENNNHTICCESPKEIPQSLTRLGSFDPLHTPQ